MSSTPETPPAASPEGSSTVQPETPLGGRAFPPDPAMQGELAYQSLSVTALISFGIAALYVAVVGLMAVFGLISGKPLLLSGWTLVFPLLAVGLGLLSLWQIRNSEETLAGRNLARWGLLLALFVTVLYWGYNLAMGLALKQQAEPFAEQFLKRIKEGKLTEATFQTFRPAQRVGLSERSRNLAQDMDMKIRSMPNPPGRSIVTVLSQTEWARLILVGGETSTYEFKGVQDWQYVQGGYQVQLLYRVKNRFCSFDLLVTVHGSESEHKEWTGRQWFVDLQSTGIRPVGDQKMELTAEGERYLAVLANSAGAAAQNWVNELTSGSMTDAFRLTLAPNQRQYVQTPLVIGPLAGGPALPLLGADPELPARFTSFLKGELFRFAPNFRGQDHLNDIKRAVEALYFPPAGTQKPRLDVERPLPIFDKVGDRVQVIFDVAFTVPSPPLTAEGVLVLECDAREAEQAEKPQWRVSHIQLNLAARTIQPPAPPGQSAATARP